MGSTRKIAKNILSLVTGQVAGHLVGFVITVYLARRLLVEGFGWINLAQAFTAYLTVLVDAGLSTLGCREIAKDTGRTSFYVSNILAIKFLIALVLFVASTATIMCFSFHPGIKLIFIGTFLFVFVRASMLEWAFQGLQRMEFIGLSRSLYKIVFLVLVLLFVRSFQNVIVVPYLDFISAFLVGLIFFVVLWLQFPFSWGEIVPRQWSKLVMEALPLGISFFLIQLYYNLDMIMLGLMRGPEAVGWYSAAYKIFWIIYGFFLLWQTAVFPEVTRRLHENISRAGEFLQRYVRITLWACVPLVIYVMLGAPDIIKIVFGEQYVAAMPALQILISTLLLMVLNGIYGHLILIPAGKQNLLMFSVILGILLNFVLNLVLISRFSLYGAAAATVISEAVILLFAFYAARREISIRVMRWVTGPLVGALGAALFFGAGSWFFRSGAPELFFALCSAGYFLAYLVLTVWVMREWDFIYGFVKNVFRDMGSSELGNN